MKRTTPAKTPKSKSRPTAAAKPTSGVAIKRASIFRNGGNQAVRLPQDLRFADSVKEVRIRKQGDGLLISPVKPDWVSFFALRTVVPDDLLADREDFPPQSRDPL